MVQRIQETLRKGVAPSKDISDLELVKKLERINEFREKNWWPDAEIDMPLWEATRPPPPADVPAFKVGSNLGRWKAVASAAAKQGGGCQLLHRGGVNVLFVGDSTMRQQSQMFEWLEVPAELKMAGAVGSGAQAISEHEVKYFSLQGGLASTRRAHSVSMFVDRSVSMFETTNEPTNESETTLGSLAATWVKEQVAAAHKQEAQNDNRSKAAVVVLNSGLHDVSESKCFKVLACVDDYKRRLRKLVQAVSDAKPDLIIFRTTNAGWPKWVRMHAIHQTCDAYVYVHAAYHTHTHTHTHTHMLSMYVCM